MFSRWFSANSIPKVDVTEASYIMRIILFFLFILPHISRSVPINNGFTLKFKPVSSKEEVKPKIFGALFAKIPQDINPETYQKEMFSKAYLAHSSEFGNGCTNQIAKIIIPEKSFEDSSEQTNVGYNNYMNLPLIQQPYKDYKIIVATAPWNVKISGKDAKPVVVYIVFPDEEDSKSMNIPKIYFVHKGNKLDELQKTSKIEPVIIVDSNRTITGIKSNEVAKYLKFKNRLTNRYNYVVA